VSYIAGEGSQERVPSRPIYEGIQPSDDLDSTSSPSVDRHHRLHWFLSLGAPVILIVAIAAVLLIVIQRSTEIPLGRGTATFTWQNTGDEQNGSKQPFNGTAAGFQASGEVTQPKDVFPKDLTPAEIESGKVKLPTVIPISDMSGSINGRHFTIQPTLTLAALRAASTPSQLPSTCTTTSTPNGSTVDCSTPLTSTNKAPPPRFSAIPFAQVSGTFGSMRIKAKITVAPFTQAFGFSGTIGTLHITGVFKVTDHQGKTEAAHATFDVTK
jgi:hypothetical protein